MELLLILNYVSICYVVFKVFKIPVTQWQLATAALGGIIGITALLLLMNYNHPFTTNARIYFGGNARAADRAGPRDRGTGADQCAAQGRGCVVPHRPEVVRIRRRSEEAPPKGPVPSSSKAQQNYDRQAEFLVTSANTCALSCGI